MSSPASRREKKKKSNSPVKLDQPGLIHGMIIKSLLACISRMRVQYAKSQVYIPHQMLIPCLAARSGQTVSWLASKNFGLTNAGPQTAVTSVPRKSTV